MREIPVTSPDQCESRELDLIEAQRDYPRAMETWLKIGRIPKAIIEYGTRPAVSLHLVTRGGHHWWYDSAMKVWVRSR